MKVILLSPYSENLVGGIINWTKYIVNYHRDEGGDIEMRLLNNAQAVGLYGTGNLVRRVITGFYNYLPICRKFKRIVSHEQFDIVHISSSASLGLIRDILISRIAHQNGVRVVVHMHFGRIPSILESAGWERWLLTILLKHIEKAIVMDMASYNALKEYGVDNVDYLPNPLSADVDKIIESHNNTQRNPYKLLFAGHIIAAKGVFELVEACKGIKNIKLQLLGHITDNETKQRLLDIAGPDAENWLSIPGNKTQEEVIQEMLSCSVFVLPSYSEGFPNVILESMACGCPIISTPVGAIPEMLDIDSDHPCGICVMPKDIDSLHQAIVRLLNEQKFASQLGLNAYRRVHSHYTMPIIWKQLVEMWDNVCKS